jgi:hypothetical protein
MYPNGRGLSQQRLRALTVIHNYGLKRQDGTTAAMRLFATDFPDVFPWLLDPIMGPLPLPREHHERVLKLGGRRQLPACGSYRSGPAQFGHPAPRAMGSLHGGKYSERYVVGGADNAHTNEQTFPTSSEHATSGDPATYATGVGLHGENARAPVHCP